MSREQLSWRGKAGHETATKRSHWLATLPLFDVFARRDETFMSSIARRIIRIPLLTLAGVIASGCLELLALQRARRASGALRGRPRPR
ncbi:MAG: hypothetical protein R3E45_11075 [Rhodocyclaceae bacterium]